MQSVRGTRKTRPLRRLALDCAAAGKRQYAYSWQSLKVTSEDRKNAYYLLSKVVSVTPSCTPLRHYYLRTCLYCARFVNLVSSFRVNPLHCIVVVAHRLPVCGTMRIVIMLQPKIDAVENNPDHVAVRAMRRSRTRRTAFLRATPERTTITTTSATIRQCQRIRRQKEQGGCR